MRVALVIALAHRPTHDTRVFTSWAHLLLTYGSHGLYAHVDTVDHYPVNYPPGYALLLGAVTTVFGRLGTHGSDAVLGSLLKIPAVVADLALCGVVYTVARRWVDGRPALVAPVLAAFAPFTWPISAMWGQVDSICATFMVSAFALCVSRRYTFAWLALACAVLVKPLPIVLVPLLAGAQIRERGFSLRSLAGPLAGIALAYFAALPFAPTAAPAQTFRWLAQQYASGQSLTDATSVNAYNVWTLVGGPVRDGTLLFGITLHTWGWLAVGILTGAATIALGKRMIPTASNSVVREQAVLRAWFVVLDGTFMFSTRMHERYVLFALALTPLLWYCGRLERAVAVVTVATFVTCVVVVVGLYEHHVTREIAAIPHLLAFVNLLAFAAMVLTLFRTPAASRAERQSASRKSPK